MKNRVGLCLEPGRLVLLAAFLSVALSPLASAQKSLYVANSGANEILRISSDRQVSTFAAGVKNPNGLAFDSSGNLYVANRTPSNTNGYITRITLGGAQSTFYTGSSLHAPVGLAFNAAGGLFCSDYQFEDGSVGKFVLSLGADGTFLAAYGAPYSGPTGVAFAPNGDLVVADYSSNRLTIGPAGSSGNTYDLGLSGPWGLAYDANNNLYISNLAGGAGTTITKYTPGKYSTFATGLSGPAGLAFDDGGNLYVANFTGGTITKIAPDGTKSVYATGLNQPTGLAYGPDPITPPAITSAATAAGSIGAAFSYQIVASGAPSAFGATGLPAGLTISAATGLISGTPTGLGTSAVTLFASNAGGTGQATLKITITAAAPPPPAPPAITSVLSAAGEVGAAFNYQITASGAPASFAATGLPAGLTIAPATGAISGTPTAAGVSAVAISATNAGGTGSATLNLTITAPTPGVAPVITSALNADGQVGAAFSYQITASGAPTAFGASGLPPGLSVSAATGQITGTPSEPGVSSVTLYAANDFGGGQATLTLNVLPDSIAVAPITPPTVTVVAKGAALAREGEAGKFILARSGGDLSQPLSVEFKVVGPARKGVDYKPTTSPAVIPAGAESVKVKIKPIANSEVSGPRKAKLKLLPSPDGSYVVGQPSKATITIGDGG